MRAIGHLLLLALICAATVLSAGAGSAGRASAMRAAGAVPTPMPADTFPLTVKSYVGNQLLGTAVIPAKPKRIISLDSTQLPDALLYLKAPLVGVTGWAFGTGSLYVKQLTTLKVQNIGNRPNWDFEKIAALHPDLIVGLPAEFDTYFAKFNAIAPTVAVGLESGPPAGALDWEYFPEQLAHLTGLSAEIPPMLAKEHAAAAALRPRFAGYHMAIIQAFPAAGKFVLCWATGGTLFNYLGAVVNPKPKKDDCDQVTPENLGTITDANILVIQNDPGQKDLQYMQQQPLWPTLPAVQAKHAFLVPSYFQYAGGPVAYFQALKDIPKYLTDLKPA